MTILLKRIVLHFGVEMLLHFKVVQFVQEFVASAGLSLATLQACNIGAEESFVVIKYCGNTGLWGVGQLGHPRYLWGMGRNCLSASSFRIFCISPDKQSLAQSFPAPELEDPTDGFKKSWVSQTHGLSCTTFKSEEMDWVEYSAPVRTRTALENSKRAFYEQGDWDSSSWLWKCDRCFSEKWLQVPLTEEFLCSQHSTEVHHNL